jgi:hypothetical protein
MTEPRFTHFIADYADPKGSVQRLYGRDGGLTVDEAKQQMAGSIRIKVNVDGKWIDLETLDQQRGA